VGVVAIVDFGLCNLDSIRRAVEECGKPAVVTSSAEDIAGASRVILPGVGAFREAMANLRALGLDRVLTEAVVEGGIPILGICLGMQLMARTGHEGGLCDGLGWIEGEVRRLDPQPGERLPHVGWNEVRFEPGCPLFTGVAQDTDFYFVHSFNVVPTDPRVVAGRTPYGGGFVSALARPPVFGVQFHPEKSQKPGFQVLHNFLAF
jgi:glutamine amidotransferase